MLVLILALVIGCTIAFQAFWIWRLHGQVDELRAQVTRLQAQVCAYQQAATGLSDEIAAAGHAPLNLPRPRDCP